MKVGMMGLGKLGLPVALTIESRNHEVIGYDINPAPQTYIQDHQIPYHEENIEPLLQNTKIRVAQSVGELVAESDIIFLAIQTPHDPEYEGTTRLPETRHDFNYAYLEKALSDVSVACGNLAVRKNVAVISTCLPGTYENKLKPLTQNINYVYTPQFIAMGTVVRDYLNPEFNLIGVEDEGAADQLEEFYATINDSPNLRTDITTAEAIKVSYNTFITMKTVLGNAWGEIAHKIGANFDDIYKAWSLSGKRLLSPKYLNAGMADGGGCHPRDNIALSHLARELELSHDIFEDLMKARENQTDWLANTIVKYHVITGLPVVILGRSFKPETSIETGSPAILLSNLLDEYGIEHLHVEDLEPTQALYFIATAHERYTGYQFPPGSTVIDPFRMLTKQDDVTIISIGKQNERAGHTGPTKTKRNPASD